MERGLVRWRVFGASIIAVGALLLTCSAVVWARPPMAKEQSYRLAALKFSGLNRFSEEQAGHAAGLKVGDSVSQTELAAAVEKLTKSGAFDNVSFRYSTSGSALNAEFQVTEVSKLLPCVFDNFVWFSDAEIDKSLRSASLYSNGVPESGTTSKDVRIALRDMIRAKGIPADVTMIPFVAGLGQPVSAFVYSVTGVTMPIRSVRFSGNAAISASALEAASSLMIGRDYSVSYVSEFASAGLAPLYRKKAIFEPNSAALKELCFTRMTLPEFRKSRSRFR